MSFEIYITRNLYKLKITKYAYKLQNKKSNQQTKRHITQMIFTLTQLMLLKNVQIIFKHIK